MAILDGVVAIGAVFGGLAGFDWTGTDVFEGGTELPGDRVGYEDGIVVVRLIFSKSSW